MTRLDGIEAYAVARQGDERIGGRYSLFRSLRYSLDYAAFVDKDLTPGRLVEA